MNNSPPRASKMSDNNIIYTELGFCSLFFTIDLFDKILIPIFALASLLRRSGTELMRQEWRVSTGWGEGFCNYIFGRRLSDALFLTVKNLANSKPKSGMRQRWMSMDMKHILPCVVTIFGRAVRYISTYRRGLCVARSTLVGHARAFDCGMSDDDRLPTSFFFIPD